MSRTPSSLELLPLSLDTQAALPMYAAIQESLLMAIRDDPAAIGKTLPIESQMAQHYGVSRMTVRQAIDLLAREGYVNKRRGKLTEIARQTTRPARERPLQRLSDILASPTRHDTRIISYVRLQSAPAARLLQLPEDNWLYCLKLEQFDEQSIIGFTEVYIAETLGSQLTRTQFEEAAQLGTLFVYPLVERETGYHAERARVTIGATDLLQLGDHDIAKRVGQHPLVRLQFIFYSQHDKPFQLSINWFDARYYSVTYDLGA